MVDKKLPYEIVIVSILIILSANILIRYTNITLDQYFPGDSSAIFIVGILIAMFAILLFYMFSSRDTMGSWVAEKIEHGKFD
jgi:hypothetical protein